MGAFDPMGFFQAGGELGKANKSPLNYGSENIMDRFNKVNDIGMQMALQTQMFKNQKDYEFNNSPVNKEANAKLNASGLGPGGSGKGGGLAGIAGVGNENGQSTSTLGTDVPTDFTSVTGQKYSNQNAEVNKDVVKKQLDDAGTEAMGAVAMKRQLDKMRDLYEGAMSKLPQSGLGSRVDMPTTGILQGAEAGALTYAQKKTLDMQGKSNPQWIAYKAAIPEFAQLAERGLYGARGRQVNQLVQQEKLAFPGGSGTKQSDDAQWSLFHQNADAPIQMYDNLHKQYLGTNSPINYVSKYDNPIVNAQQNQQSSVYDEGTTKNFGGITYTKKGGKWMRPNPTS